MEYAVPYVGQVIIGPQAMAGVRTPVIARTISVFLSRSTFTNLYFLSQRARGIGMMIRPVKTRPRSTKQPTVVP